MFNFISKQLKSLFGILELTQGQANQLSNKLPLNTKVVRSTKFKIICVINEESRNVLATIQ